MGDNSVFLFTSPKDRRDAYFASRRSGVYYFGMDELEISGKRYISTRRAAREHGYHSDYMGQLIRGKKVVGQKVGRAWYIEEGSLNAYLGVASQTPEPVTAVVPVEAPVTPAPVERLVIEEPVVVAPVAEPVAAPVTEPVFAQAPVAEPVYVAPVVEPVVAQPVQPVEVEQPAQVRAIYNEPHTPVAHAAPVQNVSYAAPIQTQEAEVETRIPIHTQPEVENVGGLRYADDDTPSIPVVSRMPVQPQYAYAPYAEPEPVRAQRQIPYVTLSIVGIVAIVASVFASNFVSATIVTEEGKSASVQYSIHW